MNDESYLSTFIGLTVTIITAVLVVATVLVPILDNVHDTYRPVLNNPIAQYAQASDDVEITYNVTDGMTTYMVNGVATTADYTAPLIQADRFMGIPSAAGMNISMATDVGEGSWNDVNEVTITYRNGYLTMNGYYAAASTTITYNSPCEWLFYGDNGGGWGMIVVDGAKVIRFSDVSELYGTNNVITTGGLYSFHGTEVKYHKDNVTTIYNATITAEKDPTYTNSIYSMNVDISSGGYEFSIPYNDSTYVVHPWHIIAPASLIGNVNGASDIFLTILDLLPIMIIVGIILTIVAYFPTSNRARDIGYNGDDYDNF